MKKVVLWLMVMAVSSALSAQRKVLPPTKPIDDVSLTAFLTQLKTAVLNKDKKTLMGLVADDVMTYFDGDNTKKAFEDNWFTSDPPSDIWRELTRALDRKGDYMKIDYINNQYSKEEYIIPYALNFDFSGEDDIFNYGMIIGSDVNIREQPSTNAKVLTKLSYDIVKMVYEGDANQTFGLIEDGRPEWYKIQTEDNKVTGWVFHKFFYSPLDYRLYLTKKAGSWKISAFIAGD